MIEALKLELDRNNWQSKVELSKALGLSKCHCSINQLEEIVFSETSEFDIVKLYAAEALVIITRKDTTDIDSILQIIKKGTYYAKEGALLVMGYDKMKPEINDMLKVIDYCWNFGQGRPQGYTDPRYGLAAACAGYKSDKIDSFLKHCISSQDQPLIYVSENSLKGKYVKLR